MDRRTFLRAVAAVPLVAAGLPRVSQVSVPTALLERIDTLIHTLPANHPFVIEAQREYNRLRSMEMDGWTIERLAPRDLTEREIQVAHDGILIRETMPREEFERRFTRRGE